MMFLYSLPEWVWLVATVVFVLLAHEAGFRIGVARRLKAGDRPEQAALAMSGTTVGLLAFMLAFTFNGASSDYNLRKQLVLSEANAVRTAYLRSMALPDPQRTEIRGLLREYVDVRVHLKQIRGTEFQRVLDRASAIQDRLWSIAMDLGRGQDNAAARFFAQTLNDVFDLHVKRLDAIEHNRITSNIWIALYFLTFLTMAMLGYRIGLSGVRSTFNEVTLALAFSSVLFVIILLDNPTGIMRISQQPLADVLRVLTP